MSECFRILRSDVSGPFVIVCDHASNYVPPEFDNLGLPDHELSRHIAWDIGAAAIAEWLSERFHSPAIFSGTSRLVIDCNRQLDARDLIPEISDGTLIPGNRGLTESDRQARRSKYFDSYHDAIESIVAGRSGSIFLSIHSMTDRMQGQFRPWPISFSSFQDRSLVEPLLFAMKELNAGDNQPYDLNPRIDYSTPFHALRRGLPHLQVEFRQDEVGTAEGQKAWAGRLAEGIEKAGILGPAFSR